MKQLMEIVAQVQNSSSQVMDLKSENSMLEQELKRRSPTASGNGGSRGGPSTRARRVIQLANSQSDPQFTLPSMFNV